MLGVANVQGPETVIAGRPRVHWNCDMEAVEPYFQRLLKLATINSVLKKKKKKKASSLGFHV